MKKSVIEWHRLSQDQQRPYEEQAEYLLEHHYVIGKDVEELAEILYLREQVPADT